MDNPKEDLVYRKAYIAIFVQRAYNAHFKTRKVPGRKTLMFIGTGSLDNQERPARDGTPHSGRPRVRTEEVIAVVEMSPKRSLRHRSQSLGLSKDTLCKGEHLEHVLK